VTKKFIADPLCSRLFLHPVDLESDAANAEYRSRIHHPMDLTTVQTRLKDKDYYSSVNAWARDFLLIFDNALQFDEGASIVSSVARFFKAKLQKQIERITAPSDADYVARVGTAVANYVDLLSRPPDGAPQCPPVEDLGGLFDEYSLNLLSQKLNKLSKAPETRPAMDGFLRGFVKGNDDDGEIDVGVLDKDKIESLWEFVRENENP
jgi:hypothetical protein